jgi:hypothetical protein
MYHYSSADLWATMSSPHCLHMSSRFFGRSFRAEIAFRLLINQGNSGASAESLPPPSTNFEYYHNGEFVCNVSVKSEEYCAGKTFRLQWHQHPLPSALHPAIFILTSPSHPQLPEDHHSELQDQPLTAVLFLLIRFSPAKEASENPP